MQNIKNEWRLFSKEITLTIEYFILGKVSYVQIISSINLDVGFLVSYFQAAHLQLEPSSEEKLLKLEERSFKIFRYKKTIIILYSQGNEYVFCFLKNFAILNKLQLYCIFFMILNKQKCTFCTNKSVKFEYELFWLSFLFLSLWLLS